MRRLFFVFAGIVAVVLGGGDVVDAKKVHANATFCMEVENMRIGDWEKQLGGSWYQVLTSEFLVSTELIDRTCVRVDVEVEKQDDPFMIIIHQSSFLHGYTNRVVNETYKFADLRVREGRQTFLNIRHPPGFELRCVVGKNVTKQADLVIWTGTDNLSMMVWAKNITQFYGVFDDSVSNYFEQINYTSHYKNPIVTFNDTACK